MSISLKLILLITTTIYHAIAVWLEDRQPPPGKLIDVGGYRLHLQVLGEANPTVIFDHSLGGIDGYLIASEIAKVAQICIYDRAGYGWSDPSPHPRSSEQIVTELDTLLTQAGIEPPYILVGNSFGSYNVRLYAHRFPDKVAGIVLTDGLHETGMLKMPISLRILQLFFASGFIMSAAGSALGIVRLLRTIGIFELIKPELRQFPNPVLNPVKRSFCRPRHWITMSREILTLDTSGQQLSVAHHLGALPLVSIKAKTFFQPSFWTIFLPLKAANQLREKMHPELLQLSTDTTQLVADSSGHFVWVDQPEVIVRAIQIIRGKIG